MSRQLITLKYRHSFVHFWWCKKKGQTLIQFMILSAVSCQHIWLHVSSTWLHLPIRSGAFFPSLELLLSKEGLQLLKFGPIPWLVKRCWTVIQSVDKSLRNKSLDRIIRRLIRGAQLCFRTETCTFISLSFKDHTRICLRNVISATQVWYYVHK